MVNHNKSQHRHKIVMEVVIPNFELVLGVILAFFIGLGGLYAYYKVHSFIKSTNTVSDTSQPERLEYYERQLIDMKIRLDALEIQGIEQKSDVDPNLELKQFLEKLAKNDVETKQVEEINKSESIPKKIEPVPDNVNTDRVNPTDYVLHLITDKAMTSRDIQITLKRSREHTSRLMKKLFEDGYVQRNTETKPYTYSITEKGKSKVEEIQTNPNVI